MLKHENRFSRLPAAFCAVLALGGITVCTQAQAHAVLDRSVIAPGQTLRLTVAIGHGCSGSPTTSLRVTIPEGLLVAKADDAAGFKAETRNGAFGRGWTVSKGTATEGVKEIVWSGGTLVDKSRGEFPFDVTVSSDLPIGQILAVPVVQICQSGENRWIEQAATPAARDGLKSPAPVLTVVRPDQAHLDLRNGRSRVTPNGAPVAGGYLTIRNFGDRPDRLIAASLSLADHVEIHEMSMTDGIMRMRALEKGLEIPAGGAVELKQGSYHLMFMKPSRAFAEGEWLEGSLTFERAGTLPVRFKVEAQGTTGHQHQAH